MAWHWTIGGCGVRCPWGVWGSQHPSQPKGLCRLLRGRLPAGTEHGWALAGSRQRRLGHPHLQPEMLQGGPGNEPPASGDGAWGAQQAGPPWEPSLHPWSRAGVGVWEGGSEAVPEVLVRGGCVGEVPSVHCPLLQHHCVVPTYNCAVSALAIHPSTNNLVIAYSDQQVGALLVQLSWPCSLPCASLPALRAFRPGSGTWLELLVRGCCQEQTPLSCPVSLLSCAAVRVQHPREAVHGLEPCRAEPGAAPRLAGAGLAHHTHHLQPQEPLAHPAPRHLLALRPRQVPGELAGGLGVPGACSCGSADLGCARSHSPCPMTAPS